MNYLTVTASDLSAAKAISITDGGNMVDITIRKALPEDANIYTDCLISCWQSAYKGIVPDEYLESMIKERDQRVGRFKKVFTNPGDCEYYCVMNAENMIGFLTINKSRCADSSYIGEIWAIYLIEEFCGKGFGKDLLDFEIQELRRVEPKEIFLWVFEDNKRARRFYEKNNFRFDGTTREVKYGMPLIQFRYVLCT